MGVDQPRLRFASFLGDNAFEFYRQVVAYLGGVTGWPAELVAPTADQRVLFERGELEAAFCCGLPYVWQADGGGAPVRLLAAPVMPGARYAGRPVYFSDFIVRRDSPYHCLADLRGARFAYNQDTSFSGCVLPRCHLLRLNESLAFFASALASGSHAASMDWVESGRADCAALDSVVLEMELRQRPERAAAFRVVESIGPAPMPPVIASRRLPEAVHARLAAALVAMHTQPAGQAILQQGGVLRFAPVTDHDYDDIRAMLRALEGAQSIGAAPAATRPV